MNDIVVLLIELTIVIVISVVGGNGAVVVFNRIPVRWFTEEGKEPHADLLDASRQRLTSTPWKWIFVAFLAAISIYLVLMINIIYAISVTVSLWLLLLGSISDIKYGIIPDQITIMLAVSALGFIIFHEEWTNQMFGALTGFLLMMITFGVGKLIYKKDAVGGGDIKVLASLGLILGTGGILILYIISTALGALHFIYLLATKKASSKDTRPMMPYIFGAFTIYVVFLWEYGINLTI